MCKVLIHLLHQSPNHRYQDLKTVKNELLSLLKNIFATPVLLRRLLGHPVLPDEPIEPVSLNELIDFRVHEIDRFSLKYLGKFICEYDIRSICINGGQMPLREIKAD